MGNWDYFRGTLRDYRDPFPIPAKNQGVFLAFPESLRGFLGLGV